MRRRARAGIRRGPRTSSRLTWLQERLGRLLEETPRQFSKGERLPQDQIADNFHFQPRKKEQDIEPGFRPWAQERMPAQEQNRERGGKEGFQGPSPWSEEMLPPHYMDSHAWEWDMRQWGERVAPPWAPTNTPDSRDQGNKGVQRRGTRPGEFPYGPEGMPLDWDWMPPPPARGNQVNTPWASRPSIRPQEEPKEVWEEVPSSYDEIERVQGRVKRYSPRPPKRRAKRRRR